MSEMIVKGSQRITHEELHGRFMPWEQKLTGLSMKTSPGWVEVEYMNRFDRPALGKREHLLAWVFAFTRGQHGFGLRVAEKGLARFADPIFEELARASVSAIKRGWWNVPLFLFHKAYKRYARYC